MKFKKKEENLKVKRAVSSIILYIAASVVLLVAVALLINNIILFRATASGYVAQGYAANDVLKQLIPSQLIPGIFEPIAVYGGIAFVLFGVARINQKVSRYLALLSNNKVEENVCKDDLETEKQTENIEEIDNSQLMK